MFLNVHSKQWKNPIHIAQWTSTLETYANPVIGNLAVGDIDTAHLVKILEPLFHRVPETASRLRGRIERIIGYATAAKFRTGDNPARWRGHLRELLGDAKKEVEHHTALPFDDAFTFMADLRGRDSISARALEFLILTTTRTAEAIYATSDEFDLKKREWTIPANRMKGKKQHRVPLSDRAVEILKTMPKRSRYVFAKEDGKPLSNMAMLELLRGMRPGLGLTVHGFRSTFRDWAAERTNYPNHVVEMQLAHKIPDKVEAAYRRGELVAKRTNLMKQWATFLAKPRVEGGNVVTISGVRGKRQVASQ